MASFRYNHLVEVAPGFWNLKAPLVMMGILDIRTHMNFCRLSNGRILVIDTVVVSPEIKVEIDHLTQNGELIDGVVATHPFHTLFFPSFYQLYPSVKYYGTPRHLRNQPQIPWAGDMSSQEVLDKWSPDVEMSISAGSEFINPVEDVHFSSVFVFHRASRTLHVDDTVMYIEAPSCLLRCLCVRRGSMSFHLSFTSNGLDPTPDASTQFKEWLQHKLDTWDFDNICTAHMGNMIGGAKEKLQSVLNEAEGAIRNHKEKYSSPVR